MNESSWETDEWCRYLPDLHRLVAAPRLTSSLPGSFLSLNFQDSCAWWETLRYIFRKLLGWRCLPAGLAWWYEAGKPDLDDPLLRLVLERWNTREELDFFAAQEWETGGVTGHSHGDTVWTDKSYEPSRDWWRNLRSRQSLLNPSPYGGGTNPLHLGHSDPVGESESTHPLHGFHAVATRRAVLVVSDFGCWRQELQRFGAGLPRLVRRSWHVEVFDRRVGFLGLFRQSRTTGLWFQGRHSIHLAGNPPVST